MPDPTPLLSTMTGASAGLVAIIGGLLVARYVGLDSEQQGAQRLLDDAQARFEVADRRRKQALEDLRQDDAQDILGNDDAIQALIDGTSDVAELREIADATFCTSDQDVQPAIDTAYELIQSYVAEIEQDLPADNSHGTDYWKERRLHSEFEQNFTSERGIEKDDPFWSHCYAHVWVSRHDAAEKRERAATRSHTGIKPGLARMLEEARLTPPHSLAPLLRGMPTISANSASSQWKELQADLAKATQQCEDIGLEVKRFRELREGVVKPKGIWPVLGVLIYASLVGIVLPVAKMATAPKDFDWQVTTLAWLFGSALLALVGVLVWQAVKLSRNKS